MNNDTLYKTQLCWDNENKKCIQKRGPLTGVYQDFILEKKSFSCCRYNQSDRVVWHVCLCVCIKMKERKSELENDMMLESGTEGRDTHQTRIILTAHSLHCLTLMQDLQFFRMTQLQLCSWRVKMFQLIILLQFCVQRYVKN